MTLVASVLKGTDNSFETTAEMFNGPRTDFGVEGVVGAITNTSGVSPATGAFAVNEAGTPDMTVDVTSGVAYVTATPTGQASQLIRVDSSTTESVVINANSTGGTRYDHIYLEINATNAAAPNASGSNVASVTAYRSTDPDTDTSGGPSYGYKLAVVTVANGASSITDANISDKRTESGYAPGAGTILPLHFNGLSTDTNTDWAWQSWTPDISLFGTLGNGTVDGAYIQIGKTVHYWASFTLGSTSAVSTGFGFNTPVTVSDQWLNGPANAYTGTAIMRDSSASTVYFGTVFFNSSARLRPVYQSGTNGQVSAVTNTGPFTWATGDSIVITGTYEAA